MGFKALPQGSSWKSAMGKPGRRERERVCVREFVCERETASGRLVDCIRERDDAIASPCVPKNALIDPPAGVGVGAVSHDWLGVCAVCV